MRDLDNGRPIKDLDVFYNEDTVSDYAFEKVLGQRFIRKNQCNGAYIDAASEILFTTVFNDMELGPDLNLINVAPEFDPLRMLQRMDFGICLIGFNGEEVIRTTEYMVDQQKQQFTLTRADSAKGVERSLKRYDRLSQKYDGWPLSIPPHLMGVVAQALNERVAASSHDVVFADGSVDDCCLGFPPEQCALVPGRHCDGVRS